MKNFLLSTFFLLIFFFSATSSICQTDTVNKQKTSSHLLDRIINLTTIKTPKHKLSFYPMATFSQRTGLSLGLIALWNITPRKKEKQTQAILTPSLLLSTKKMIEAELTADIFLKKWAAKIKTQYLFLPDEFFGIGNQYKEKPYSFFNMNRFLFESDILRNITKNWLLGVRIDINYNRFGKIKGDLLNPTIIGYKGKWANGIGPIIVFDTRNDKIYPSKGMLASISTTFYNKFIKSNYDFILSTLNIRYFIPLHTKKSVLALQVFLSQTTQNTPFFKLPFIGDKHRLRGFSHPYLYMDKSAWFVQSEWRRHIWWRLGGVLFLGAGKVSKNLLQKPFEQTHFVAGGGVRFNVFGDINLRVDVGASNNQDLGIFFTIREAF